MPAQKLKEYLDQQQVKYLTIRHSPAYTAQEVASMAHVSGKELAKTVMVKIEGQLAMAVLPASHHVDLEALREAADAQSVELAAEAEFRDKLPGCETGAIPPFGNLYGMKVFVADVLREDEEIAFSAGTHSELIRLSYRDFEKLVQPCQFAAFAQV